MKLVINNLTKTYKNGVKAIDNLSIEIGTGMFGLLGPNGAGNPYNKLIDTKSDDNRRKL